MFHRHRLHGGVWLKTKHNNVRSTDTFGLSYQKGAEWCLHGSTHPQVSSWSGFCCCHHSRLLKQENHVEIAMPINELASLLALWWLAFKPFSSPAADFQNSVEADGNIRLLLTIIVIFSFPLSRHFRLVITNIGSLPARHSTVCVLPTQLKISYVAGKTFILCLRCFLWRFSLACERQFVIWRYQQNIQDHRGALSSQRSSQKYK